MTSSPIYERHTKIFQIARRWHVITELQILLVNGTAEWFNEKQWQTVKKLLEDPFQERFHSKDESKHFDVLETKELLVAYKFQHFEKSHKKDAYLVSLPKQKRSRDTTRDSYGKFKPCFLRNEKVTITVSNKYLYDEFQRVTKRYSKFDGCSKESSKSFGKQSLTPVTADTTKEATKVLPKTSESELNSEDAISFCTKIGRFKRSKKTPIENMNKENDNASTCNVNTEESVTADTGESMMSDIRESKTKKSIPGKSQKVVQNNSRVRQRYTKETEKLDDKSKRSSVKLTVNDKECSSKSNIRTKRSNLVLHESILELACDNSNAVTEKKSVTEITKASTKKRSIETQVKLSGILDEKSKKPRTDLKEVREIATYSTTHEISDSDEFESFPAFTNKQTKSRRKKLTHTNSKKRKKQADKGKQHPSTANPYSLENLIQHKDNIEDYEIEERIDTPKLCIDDTIDLDDYGNVSLENISDVTELTIDQIRDIVRSLEDDLRAIFEGKVHCERHEQYKKGGRERECLNMQVSFGAFNEEQEGMVTKILREMFCKRRTTYFDYVIKVLLPETLLMIYQKVCGCSREEAVLAFCR